jgi:methylenetetrahydrofolate dehydrogenase (NADP+)/methenyltetrahydrofolate cyclohydrolase
LIYSDKTAFLPCTPKGIIKLLDEHKIDLTGKNAVIIGRSTIVGKPLSLLLLEKNATVTICHSKSNLAPHLKNADIVISAVGKANFLKGKMLKKGVIVIDVGINVFKGKLCGDVEWDSVYPIASYITPVPGGVGPLTIASLLENTLQSYLSKGV